MAGMLPGVECARRRRFHKSGGGWPESPNASSSSGHGSSSTSRRSSFCLYTSNNESHFSTMSYAQRSPQSQANCDETLCVVAREAKERLDRRLRAQWIPESKRSSSSVQQQTANVGLNNNEVMLRQPKMEISGLKKEISKILSKGKLSWKSSEQDECSICLEKLMEKETPITQLPCAHSFHSKCLIPWLRDNSHCPCCRMKLSL